MKIVIATAVYYPMTNGVAVFSRNLAMGLAARGHEVLVLCPSQTGKNYARTEDGVKVNYLKSINTRVYPDQINAVPPKKKMFGLELPHLFYKKGFKVSIFPASEVKKALSKFQPDVVHIQISDPIGLSVASYAKKNHIPVVTTEHNQPEVITEPLKIPSAVRRPVNYLLSSYFRNRQSKSDFVTMPTEQAIRSLLEKHPINVPIAAVSNGVDLSDFKPGKPDDKFYSQHKLYKVSPTVVYVGRVDPEKKVGLVIEAFSNVIKRGLTEAQMIIAGDGVDKLRLEKLARELGVSKRVKFLGRVMPPELYKVYQAGDVFATASEVETQGIVLIEAAASGLPLVAVNKGAVSEVCINKGNGFLCQPGNVSELSDALYKILSDTKLQKKFAANSLKIAHEHDFERTLDKFINIYERVIQTKI